MAAITVDDEVRPRRNLTRKEAAVRSALISDVHYTVALGLTSGEQEFTTSTTVRFRARSAEPAVLLDFAGTPALIECNGQEVTSRAHDGTRIEVPVRPGENTVRVIGTAPYSRTGEGLHRFCDPLDGESYVHTKFEPFAAHKVYACFDQPDLKAVLDLSVSAPEQWVVVANSEAASEPTPTGDRLRTWRFRSTPAIPPYLTAFAAGPFRRLHHIHRGLPLALYVRPSRFEDLNADAAELFDVIKRGLDFYCELFGLPYPFAKYDHVFAPEYAFGGMEHPGCVTINERLVFRHRVTAESKRRRAELLLHEMAHMWFGNYVTMRWWDDLWLNESFATMMAVVAQPEATGFGDGWAAFAHRALPIARHADQLPTSHAISVDTVDTDAARLNFNPLVYKKGAGVLHDFAVRIGWDVFIAGIRRYLRAHAWGNADFDDFVAALRQESSTDVDRWAEEWLRRPGLNTVEVSRLPGANWVVQVPESEVRHRHLQLSVGTFEGTDAGLVRRERSEVVLSPQQSEAQLPTCRGAGHLMVPNDDALSHVKVRLDPQSRRTALRRLSCVRDERTRAVLWGALWDDVLDARLPARSFASTVLTHAAAEPDIGVLELLWERAVEAVRVYADPFTNSQNLHALFRRARDGLARAVPGSDDQLVLARTLVATIPKDASELLSQIVCGRFPWPGVQVDRDLRWRALLRLATVGADVDGLLGIALQADPEDEGRRYALTVRAARPVPSAKEEAWERVFRGDHSLAERKAVMEGMRQPGQEEILTPYANRYFQVLERIWDTAEPEFAVAFARLLYPRYTCAEQDVLAPTEDLLSRERIPVEMRRILSEERAELVLMRAARMQDAAHGTEVIEYSGGASAMDVEGHGDVDSDSG